MFVEAKKTREGSGARTGGTMTSGMGLPGAAGRDITAVGGLGAGEVPMGRAGATAGAGADAVLSGCVFAVALTFAGGLERRDADGGAFRFADPATRPAVPECPARGFARFCFGRDPLAFARFGCFAGTVGPRAMNVAERGRTRRPRPSRSTRDTPFSKRNLRYRAKRGVPMNSSCSLAGASESIRR
jgi:hypothetical protein